MESSRSRRKFCRLCLSLVVAAPPMATGQRSTSVRRIGRLDVGRPDPPEKIWQREAPLRELGWIEGENLHVERRYANSLEDLNPLAEELVRAKVEVIVANGPNPTRAAMRATSTIPIVFT